MTWYENHHPDCDNNHPAIKMEFASSVLHGQDRKYRCIICEREVLISNNPQLDRPELRVLRQGDH